MLKFIYFPLLERSQDGVSLLESSINTPKGISRLDKGKYCCVEPLAQQIKAACFYGYRINITESYARHFIMEFTKREKSNTF